MRSRLHSRLHGLVLTATVVVAAGIASPTRAGTVDLGAAPPNLTTSVAPNIAITFDDSGSMQWDFLSDRPPFTVDKYGNRVYNYGWSNIDADTGDNVTGGPWYCAGVIDPRSSASGILTHVMNGVYYNPSIVYNPPLRADGSSFPNADATLKSVWNDGVSWNRPLGADTSFGTTNFNNTGSGRSTQYWECPFDNGNYVNGDGNGNTLGYYVPTPGNSNTFNANGGTSPVSGLGGGPYYYYYSGPTPAVDQYGNPTASGVAALYKASNWKAVKVGALGIATDTKQNWANWWAYYRTHNQAARTALSRVFGDPSLATTQSDGSYGNTLRVAWQNFYNGLWNITDQFLLQSSTIITALIDQPGCVAGNVSLGSQSLISGTQKTPPKCYRTDFYNWIFQVPTQSSTPTRGAMVRAGQFFQRGNGNTGATGDLHDPYWQPPQSGTGSGNELYCRQNYHLLLTDGLWNADGTLPAISALVRPGGTTLPDGVAFPTTSSGLGSIYAPQDDNNGGNGTAVSLSDIAFNYWATNLRPDLYKPTNNPPQIVPPYLPDQTTTVFGTTGTVSSNATATQINPEIYFNPNNDPATWPHVDQFLVGMGVAGNLNFSSNTDCTDTTTPALQDACALRKRMKNSQGLFGWPTPDSGAANGNGSPANIDDTWHAALAGRGGFFSAANPQTLITSLTSFLANITARSGSAVALTTTNPVATASTASFVGGYNADWSGNLAEYGISPATGQTLQPPVLDAACVLTGSTSTNPCPSTGQTNITQAPAYDTRAVYTYGTLATPTQAFTTTGFSSLSAWDQCKLNNGTWNAGTSACTGADANGTKRVAYLRGDRTYEAAGSTPQFRSRKSLLGAIVDSQPLYVGSPTGGFTDSWPAGSPEAAGTAQTYSAFVKAMNGRATTLYAAANDGMLHAFSVGKVAISASNAVSLSSTGGVEQWAYVPQTVIQNGMATAYVNSSGGLIPTVDGGMTEQDVFFTSDQKWHTILVGSLRLGGRGIYALDITNPAAPTVLWEFSNTSSGGADLGYTFATPNIARISYNTGTWVVLLSSGYMPTGSSNTDPATSTESLFVLDARTGTLIKELKTSAIDSKAYGLATPGVWSYGTASQVDNIAAAGDLMGNLWRFDLTDANPGNWKIDKMFQTPNVPATTPAQQPITVQPNVFSDVVGNGGNPIWIFGTGKYLAPADNTSTSAPTQAYYGIRDYGTGSSKYPISVASLVTQTLSEGGGIRALTQCPTTGCGGAGSSVAPGWTFNMIDSGERDVAVGSPLYSNGQVILSSLIPSNNNPCQPGLTGAVMLIDVSTGGAPSGPAPTTGGGYTPPTGSKIVGVTGLPNAPTSGSGISPVIPLGGGRVLIPGLPGFSISDSFWHRRSWRELLNGQ